MLGKISKLYRNFDEVLYLFLFSMLSVQFIPMKIFKTKILTDRQKEEINALWNSEYPAKLKDRFPILLEGAAWHNHYIIEESDASVIAWAVDFQKEKQVRFSIIVSSIYKGIGLGSALIDK